MVVRLFFAAVFVSFVLMAYGCTRDVAPVIVPAGAIEVKVPVPVCGANLEQALNRSSVNARPLVLPIQLLSDTDRKDFDKVGKAYAQTIALLVEYTAALESDQQEAKLMCSAAKEHIKSLNTVYPNIPSVNK